MRSRQFEILMIVIILLILAVYFNIDYQSESDIRISEIPHSKLLDENLLSSSNYHDQSKIDTPNKNNSKANVGVRRNISIEKGEGSKNKQYPSGEEEIAQALIEFEKSDREVKAKLYDRVQKFGGSFQNLFESESIDSTWAPQMENSLREVADDLIYDRFENSAIGEIQCRTSMCKLSINSSESELSDVSSSMLMELLNFEPKSKTRQVIVDTDQVGSIVYFITR